MEGILMNDREFSLSWKGDGYYLIRTKSNGSGIFRVLMVSQDLVWLENKHVGFLYDISDIKEIQPVQTERIG